MRIPSWLLGAVACAVLAACSDEPARIPIPPVNFQPLEAGVAKRVRDAQATFDKVKAGKPENAALGRAYGELGMVYQAQALLESAEAAYRNAIALDPANARWPYFLAHVYRDTGRLEPAQAQFAAALKGDSSNVAARLYLGDVSRQLGKLDEAARNYAEAAIAHEKAKAAAAAGLGKVALAQRRFPEAVTHLEEALRLWPTATQLHNSLAMAYRGAGDEAKAAQHLKLHNPSGFEPGIPDPLIEEMRDLAGGARVHLARGAKAHLAGRPDLAEESFREAVASDRDNAEAHLNLGVVLANRGELKDAEESLATAARLDPKGVIAAYSLAMVFDRQGTDRPAAENYERAIALDPQHVKAKYFLAEAYMRAKRFRDAAKLFGEVLESAPGDLAPIVGLASAQIRLGQYAKARQQLEAALKIDAAHPAVRNALARVLAAAPDPQVREPRRALELATALFSEFQNTDVGQTLAMALAANGQYAQAVSLQRATIAKQREAGHMVPSPFQLRNLERYERSSLSQEPWPDDDPWFRPHSAA